MPARTIDWTQPGPIADDPARRFDTGKGTRGSNMNGTSVLLTLEPPNYEPRVMIMGGSNAAVRTSVQQIDLSVANPAWVDLADMSHERVNCTSVLLPDGRVLVVGGIFGVATGGPVETFDPQNPGDGWVLGPESAYPRLYHSSMILLPDGSVLIGGDDDGVDPCERYFPEYYDLPRPSIVGAPATINFGTDFTVQVGAGGAIAEAVLMRPGAVTHGFDMSQRRIALEFTAGPGPNDLTVTSPPHGNVAPPGYYLLFLLDGDRLPSEGHWVRLTT